MTNPLHPVLEDQSNVELLPIQPFSATRRDATLPDIGNKVLLLVLHREQLFNAGAGIDVRAAYDWLLEKSEQV